MDKGYYTIFRGINALTSIDIHFQIHKQEPSGNKTISDIFNVLQQMILSTPHHQSSFY